MNKQKKKIVVIGGGNGSAICLEGLKKYTDKFDISAVIFMSDSGGSSKRIRHLTAGRHYEGGFVSFKI